MPYESRFPGRLIPGAGFGSYWPGRQKNDLYRIQHVALCKILCYQNGAVAMVI